MRAHEAQRQASKRSIPDQDLVDLAATPAADGTWSAKDATEFDLVVAGLAASLIRVPADAIDAQIVTTLRIVGEFLGADRGGVTQLDPARRLLTRTHLWVRAGTSGPPVSDSADKFPWMVTRLWKERELLTVSSLDELPPEAAHDRVGLEQNGVVAGALAPMVIEEPA